MAHRPPPPEWLQQCARTLGSLAIFVAVDMALREAFKAMQSSFPPALAGMLLTIALLVGTTPRWVRGLDCFLTKAPPVYIDGIGGFLGGRINIIP